MNPIGNPDSSWSIFTENGEENQNENTVEIHNVENASGSAMQKQAGQAGVIEGGNTATLKRGPSKKKTRRKRRHTWGGGEGKAGAKKKPAKGAVKMPKHYLKQKAAPKYKIQKKWPKYKIQMMQYKKPQKAAPASLMTLNEWMKFKPIPYENPETVENTDFFN